MTALTLPKSSTELEEMLGDDTRMKNVSESYEGGVPKFLSDSNVNITAHDPAIHEQIRNQTQRVLAEMLKDDAKYNRKLDQSFEAPRPGNAYHKGANPKAIGAPLNGKFSDLTTFLQAMWSPQANAEMRQIRQTVLDYQEKVPSEGGFLVPEEFRAEMLRLSLDSAIVRPRARVIPMSSATLKFPKVDTTTNAGSVFGGVVVYRTEEGAELVESQAAFGAVKLEATKQTALAYVTNELVRDWGAFGVFINEIFPEAMAWYEDLDFLAGTGVGEPKGALSAANTAMIAVPKETAQTAATIVWENVIKMYSRMLPSSKSRAVWLATPEAFAELATMALSVGTGGSAVWLTDATGTPNLTLLGRPVIESEKAPAVLGTQGDLSFVDFGYYLIGDRQHMTVDSSEHVKFTSDKMTYRVIQRNDGQPWLDSAITPQNGGPTLSPFVQLATRS